MYYMATFTRLDTNADGLGGVNIVLTYTSNTGQIPIPESFAVNLASPPTTDYLRGLAMRSIARLNRAADFVTSQEGSIGTVLDTTTPLPADPVAASYVASSVAFSPGATAQDVFTITGSDTKIVTVSRIGLITTQTTGGSNQWALIKRSTTNTGGTSDEVPAVPTNDLYPSATAVVRQYTANPTAGTLRGQLWKGRVAAPDTASANPGQQILGDIGQRNIVLSGANSVLAWNFGGVAVPAGLSVLAFVWWTEN